MFSPDSLPTPLALPIVYSLEGVGAVLPKVFHTTPNTMLFRMTLSLHLVQGFPPVS